MQISLLCSDENHPVNNYLQKWAVEQQNLHFVEIVRNTSTLSGGDILFLISCSEFVSTAVRAAYRATLIMHASDLPQGRGWSPHIWQIINGHEEITLSLIEADDKIDCGKIWKKIKFFVPKHALWSEINTFLFRAEIELLDFAVREFNDVKPIAQPSSIEATYYPRRYPKDSQIDPRQSIFSQFDKIRVCDPNRFPAYFELYGKKYKIILEKIDE